jgi:nucleoside-diphosphate-sugar epimerase
MGEVALEEAARRTGGRRIAARLFNVIGLNDPVEHLFPLVLRARGGTARLDAEGLRWARDFVHVQDIARSLVDLAAIGPAGFTAVNVCTGTGTTGWDMAKRFNVNVKDDPSRRRTGGGHLVGDNALLREITGRAPAAWEEDRL